MRQISSDITHVKTHSDINNLKKVDGALVYVADKHEVFICMNGHWTQVVEPEKSETKILREFVRDELTFAQRDQLMIDYDELERNGAIGDCYLREVVDVWNKRMNNPLNTDFFGPARDILFEVYRLHSQIIMRENEE